MKRPNKKIINEAWYNTVLDVVGIFDPTGGADLLNAVLYFKQGDTFFGILSLISVIPYAGDVVAKPIMGLGKGSKLFKSVDEALVLAKTNPKAAEALLTKITANGKNPMLGKLMSSTSQWGGKFKNLVDAIPGGKLSVGFKSMLKQWVDLFETVGKSSKTIKASVSTTAKGLGRMSPKDATKALELLKKEIKDPKLISSFGKKGNIFKNYASLWRDRGIRTTLLAGFPRLFFGKNPALRSLMRNTKFYFGFLDWVGVANFVGPEELTKQMGEDEVQKKMEEYLQTREGQEKLSEDLAQADETQTTSSTTVTQTKPEAPKMDPLDMLVQSMLKPI
jgi:hypothetical protein